jgi:hypothetical protein
MFCVILKAQCLPKMLQIILMRSSKSQRMTVMAPGLLARKTGTVLSPLQPRLHVSSLALPCRQVHILFNFHASCYSTTAVGWQLGPVEGEVNVWAKNTHCWVCRMSSIQYIIWWIPSFTCMVIVHVHLSTAVILCWVEKSFFFKCLVIDLCEYILDCLWNCEWVFLVLFFTECVHYTILLHLCDYIHEYTLCRFWNFWCIFKQSTFFTLCLLHILNRVESLFNVHQFKGFPQFNIKYKLSRDRGHSVAFLQFAVYLYLVFSLTASQMAIQTLILHGIWLLFCFCSSYDKYTSSCVH